MTRAEREALRDAAEGVPANAEVAALYAEAFARYRTIALWSYRAIERPTLGDALVVARALRDEGDLRARGLAERIEMACRAAV